MEHYENLLAEYYTWMFGVSYEEKVEEQRQLLLDLGVPPVTDGAEALDLGCGSGFQSVALADLGYRVTAIDSSSRLLRELDAHKDDRAITTQQADVGGLSLPAARVAVCMGDTLTHLPDREAVTRLLFDVHRALVPDGMFVITYRDLAAGELTGTDRFLFLRGDENCVMTCFLEYQSPEIVMVHDLVHVKDSDGNWTLLKSCYPKLRLSMEWVIQSLQDAGFRIGSSHTGRMTAITAYH